MTKIFYDFTNYKKALKSLIDLLDISEIEILRYVYENKDHIDARRFMVIVKRYPSKMFMLHILLTSLHVTTNDDACSFMRKSGIVNLQQALTWETPLYLFLRKHGIRIDIEEVLLYHHSQSYKINDLSNGHADRDHALSRIYKDYSVYGYIRSDNVLDNNKQVHQRPDIVQAIAEYLSLPELTTAYEEDPNNQCYIVKYAVPIYYYQYPTYNISQERLHEILMMKTPLEMKIMIITWLVEQALIVIHDHVHYRNCRFDKYISCLKPDFMVYPKQIQSVMTVDDYKMQYLSGE